MAAKIDFNPSMILLTFNRGHIYFSTLTGRVGVARLASPFLGSLF